VYEEARDCGFQGSGRCIVNAISNYTDRASTYSLEKAERATALRFLIHFIGDAHQPLHIGFAEDFGGTHLMLSKPPGVSLHEVWDSFLVRTGKGGVSSETWFSLGSSLSEEVVRSGVSMPTFTVPQAKAFAASIVSEVTTELTCEKAYKDFDWIESGDALSEEYMKSRREIALDLFKRAGVRLAQVLNEVASVFYLSERKSFARVMALDLIPIENRFELLLTMDFDPEDFVTEIDHDSTHETIISEEITEDSSSVVSDSVIQDRDSVEMKGCVEEERSRNQKRRDRKKVNKRKVFGVDLDSLVLIKRYHRFYITSKSLVTSDLFEPFKCVVVSVSFRSGENLPYIIPFSLDLEVYRASPDQQASLIEATFSKLMGREAIAKLKVVRDASDSLSISLPKFYNPVVFRGLLKSWTEALGGLENVDWAPFSASEFSTVEKLISRKPTPKEVRIKYGGFLPTEDQRINDAFNRIKSDLAVIQYEVSILFVSSFEYLKDHTNLRWLLNVFTCNQRPRTATDPGHNFRILVDARLFDENLTREAAEYIVTYPDTKGRKKRRSLLKNLEVCPLIIFQLYLLSDLFFSSDDPMIPFRLVTQFQGLTHIKRPQSGGLFTIDLVIRNVQESLRAARILRLDEPSLSVAERRILAQNL
jgi:hypothetical protein